MKGIKFLLVDNVIRIINFIGVLVGRLNMLY